MLNKSVNYAVARIHALERDALDSGKLERLLAAPNHGDALRALAEIGWTGADTAEKDAEAIAAERVRRAYDLVRKITPDANVTDCFMLRYDALNIKTLLKARCLSQRAEYLSPCGVYPVDLLQHATAEHRYKKLPETLAAALDALEEKLAVRVDALLIDAAVDKAVFRLISEKLGRVRNVTVRGYFRARADLLNAITLLRVRRAARDAAFFMDMLLPGGSIGAEAWQKAFEKPETVGALLERYGKPVRAAALAACQDANRLPALEKAADDALLRMFSVHRRECLSMEPIPGHLLAAEREAAAVRLILAGKANGFAPEAIRERLRDLYGG